MPAPSIQVTLRKSSARLNPQDLSAITNWVGTSSLGVANVMQTVTQQSSLRTTAGYSPACSGVSETLGIGGAPVYFTPSAIDTPGTASVPVKTPASAGVATYVGGYVKLAGADADGDIGFQSREAGVTIVVTVGANSATVTGSTGAWNVALTIPAAAASLFETFWNGVNAGAVAARALVNATFWGTKASNAGTSLSSTILDNGAITLTAPSTGYRYKLTIGVSQTASATYSTKDLTIALGTTMTTEPTGLASAMVTLINATPSKIVAAPVGNATGILGILPSGFTALQYGSTAALTLTGNPTDYMPDIHVVCSTAGALGTAQIRWTIDGQAETLSAPLLVPGSGLVVMSAANFDSGLTLNFSGILEKGDYWDSAATAPVSSTASLLAAATAALGDPTRKFGVLAIAQPLTLSQAQQLDNLVQTKWGTKFDEMILPVRDRTLSAGAYTETDAAYVVALSSEFLAFSSNHGLIDLVPAGYVFADGYTGYSYGLPAFDGTVTAGRPCVIAAVARNSAIPVHESLGRVATGSIRNCSGISHDERTAPGLFDKFITTQTYDQRPGQQFFSGSTTTADPSDPAYTREPWVSLACQVGRIAAEAAFIFLGDTVATIAVPENNGASPAGAFTTTQAAIIEDVVTKPVEDFLFAPKTDGRPSAERLPATDSDGTPLKTVTCLRDYDAKGTKQIRLEVLFNREGIIESVVIGINLL